MFCIHCGKEIPDDAKFCKFCGQSCLVSHISEPQIKEEAKNIGGTAVNRSNITCPHCGQKDCQPIIKTTAQSQSNNYSCLGGACGGLLLGPIGLLLGLCGGKSSSSVSTKTKWVCMNCGKEFFSLEDARKEWKGLAGMGAILLGIYIPFFILGLFMLIIASDVVSGFSFLLWDILLGAFLWGPALWAYSVCKKGYDCYPLRSLFTEEELSEWKRKTIKKFGYEGIILLVIVLILIIRNL